MTAILQRSLYSLPLIGLAFYILYHLYRKSRRSLGGVPLIITGYDAKIEMLDESSVKRSEIPSRFILGCDNDMIEARRRWEITFAWREEFGIDNVRKTHDDDDDDDDGGGGDDDDGGGPLLVFVDPVGSG